MPNQQASFQTPTEKESSRKQCKGTTSDPGGLCDGAEKGNQDRVSTDEVTRILSGNQT